MGRNSRHSEDSNDRHYRKTTGEGHKSRIEPEKVKVEGDSALRIAARVKQNVEEAMQSEEIERRIAQRLREERARLEQKVTAQLEAEKVALLAKKREQQLERKWKQDELERILQDNKLKVEEAQQRAAEERRQRQQEGAAAADLTKVRQKPQGIRVMEA